MDKFLTVVNKNEHFNEEMLDGLDIIDFKDEDGDRFISKYALDAFENMKKAIEDKRQIKIKARFTGRSVKNQQEVFEEMKQLHGEEWANEFVATPGQSEHHLGLAIDIGVFRDFSKIEKKFAKVPILGNAMKRDIRMKMLKEIQQDYAEFGFILRYPEGKKDVTGYDYEPWHIRFVGVEHAKAMKKNGLCLEEYVAKIKEQENALQT